MKLTTAIALATTAAAAPNAKRQSAGGCESAVTLSGEENVFESYTLHANSFYRSEIEAAIPDMDADIAAAAEQVAEIGTFVWW